MPKKTKPPAKAGRPSSYADDIADDICEAIAQGGALHRLCAERDGWPSEATVYRWLETNEIFREKYARARERQADRFADEIIIIADTATDASIGRLKLDARKWHASKTAPKKYGDRTLIEGPGKDGAHKVETFNVIDRILAMQIEIDARDAKGED